MNLIRRHPVVMGLIIVISAALGAGVNHWLLGGASARQDGRDNGEFRGIEPGQDFFGNGNHEVTVSPLLTILDESDSDCGDSFAPASQSQTIGGCSRETHRGTQRG